MTIGKRAYYPHANILLETLDVIAVRGFTKSDVAKLLDVAEAYQEFLIDAWEAHFGEEE